MKDDFEKLEKGLRLLKEEGEKNIKDISFVNRFLNSIERERIISVSLKWKYSFVFLSVILLISNLFLIHKLNFQKKNILVFNEQNIKNKPSIVEKEKIEIDVKKQDLKEEKFIDRKNEIKRLEEKPEKSLKLEDTIKFTEEVNKIIGLFTINFKMGENDV